MVVAEVEEEMLVLHKLEQQLDRFLCIDANILVAEVELVEQVLLVVLLVLVVQQDPCLLDHPLVLMVQLDLVFLDLLEVLLVQPDLVLKE